MSPISTTFCTCATSLALRVISVAAPKSSNSLPEKRSTDAYTSRRMSRPTSYETRETKYAPNTAATRLATASAIMSAPSERIEGMSPGTMPLSTMRAVT